MNRHPSVDAITQFFEYEHLPEPLKSVSGAVYDLHLIMLGHLADSPEFIVGLRKLLEAKDCFVRAALAQENARNFKEELGKPLTNTPSRA